MEKQQSIRLFTAYKCSDQMVAHLDSIQKDLERVFALYTDLEFKPELLFHITLVFLGQVPLKQLEPLEGVLRHCARTFPKNLLQNITTDSHISLLHNSLVIRVSEQAMGSFVHYIEQALKNARLYQPAPHRPYIPHVTVGRVRTVQNVKLFNTHLLQDIVSTMPDIESITMSIDSFSLFHSLGDKVYEELFLFELETFN